MFKIEIESKIKNTLKNTHETHNKHIKNTWPLRRDSHPLFRGEIPYGGEHTGITGSAPAIGRRGLLLFVAEEGWATRAKQRVGRRYREGGAVTICGRGGGRRRRRSEKEDGTWIEIWQPHTQGWGTNKTQNTTSTKQKIDKINKHKNNNKTNNTKNTTNKHTNKKQHNNSLTEIFVY